MHMKQNSIKELGATLRRVQSKRLTHRGINAHELNASRESLKYFKKHQNMIPDKYDPQLKENISYVSPK